MARVSRPRGRRVKVKIPAEIPDQEKCGVVQHTFIATVNEHPGPCVRNARLVRRSGIEQAS